MWYRLRLFLYLFPFEQTSARRLLKVSTVFVAAPSTNVLALLLAADLGNELTFKGVDSGNLAFGLNTNLSVASPYWRRVLLMILRSVCCFAGVAFCVNPCDSVATASPLYSTCTLSASLCSLLRHRQKHDSMVFQLD